VTDEIIKLLDATARDVVDLLMEVDDADAVVIYASKDGSYEVLSIDGMSEEAVTRSDA
jgi:hypothetical protein